jgi:hypothetical protein
MGRGSKSAGDLIKIIFADFMPALLQVSISVALAATVEPLVGGIMLASDLTSFLVTRTQLRSQDGVRVGIARKKNPTLTARSRSYFVGNPSSAP